MQYIVLDLEWNQAWPGSSAARKGLPLHGEIIQMGAVRLLEDRSVADEFQILVQPHFFGKLNKKVSSLTGIKEARLKAEGLPFPEAVARFRAWCGEDAVFLPWGFDDIMILRENLAIHGLSSDWVLRWYNAQMMFNAQTDGVSNQRALKKAMEMMGIEPSRPAHDALGDAYHTALICARLDLARGMEEYNQSIKRHEDGFHGAELPGCIDRRVYHGYPDKQAALAQMAGPENFCPLCGQAMEAGKWLSQPRRRFMNLSTCAQHGRLLVRIRLQPEEDGTYRASRLVYDGQSEAAKAYEKAAAAAAAAAPAKRRRSRRRRKARSKAAVQPKTEA